MATDTRTIQGRSTAAAGVLRSEPRWPVVVAVVAVLALLVFLPARVRVLPPWSLYAVAATLLVPLIAVAARPRSAAWPRIERIVTFAFIAVAAVGSLAGLGELIFGMIRRSQAVNGLQLLTSSIAVWATNVLMFSLLYWQMDPAARACG